MDEPVANAPLKKKDWVAALRSGEYSQCYGFWSDRCDYARKYCCLGVAGKINGLAYADYAEVADLLGMSSGVVDELTRMNDVARLSFDKIADWVETHDLKTGEVLSSSSEGEA